MIPIRSLGRAFTFLHGNILVLSVTGLLGNFSRAMAFPYASLFILALGGRAEQIGLINALAPLMGLVLFPIAGYITDHAGRVKLIVASGYLAGIFLLFYVLAPSWEVVALATLLRGVIVLQFPGRSAIVADSLAPQDRGRGVATMRTLSGVLAIFAPFVAGWIVEYYGAEWGMRLLYGVMTASYLTSAALQHRFLKETAAASHRAIRWNRLVRVLIDAYREIPELLRRLPRPLSIQAVVLILGITANALVSPFWVVYAVEEIGLTSAQWGVILLVETSLRNALFLPAGALVDRFGRARLLLIALLLSTLAMPAFVLARSFGLVLATRVGVAAAQALFIPASVALMADQVPRELRGRVMAALGQGGLLLGSAGGGTGGPGTGFLMTLPIMAAALAGGALYSLNPSYPWLVVLSTLVIALALVAFYLRDPENAEA